jgi:hypothetical protein
MIPADHEALRIKTNNVAQMVPAKSQMASVEMLTGRVWVRVGVFIGPWGRRLGDGGLKWRNQQHFGCVSVD